MGILARDQADRGFRHVIRMASVGLFPLSGQGWGLCCPLSPFGGGLSSSDVLTPPSGASSLTF